MRKVHFPRFVPWWEDARNQLLKFPYGAHDDFVDWLAHIGLGLVKEMGAASVRPVINDIPKTGNLDEITNWVKSKYPESSIISEIDRTKSTNNVFSFVEFQSHVDVDFIKLSYSRSYVR